MKLPNFSTLKRGVVRIFAHPQLWLTVLVAVAIFASFIYIADRFADIARDAQERLVNVRVGSLQDAFAPLSAPFMMTPEALTPSMRSIQENNPTIVEFIVAKETEQGWIAVASIDDRQLGTKLGGYDFVLSLARADPSNSYTIQETGNGTRYFRTARAITASTSEVLGVVVTRQTLSEADRMIADNIRASFLVLSGILALLLILFFHHARIIDYTELYKRLKEADQMKDDFVSMVSHELRSPLTIIRGYVSELRENPGQASAGEYLKRIDDAAQAQNALIGDILDVAKIEQGRLSYEIKAFDPKPVITSITDGFKVAASAKGLTIAADIPDGILISADENRVRQIATNFISNAVKYSDKGEIAVKGSSDGKLYTLRVSDQGIGMTAEEVKKLFGKFYRVPGERVRQEVGTGLGLWITKQLVENMGGTVSVESIKGVGSHFIVTFPLASAASAPKAA